VRGSVQGRCDYTTALDIEVDPERRYFSRHESDGLLCAFISAVPVVPITNLLCVCVCLLLQDLVHVCVFITAGPSTKQDLFTWGGGGIWEDMCYERRRAEACVD
jgi:hypothetical protein